MKWDGEMKRFGTSLAGIALVLTSANAFATPAPSSRAILAEIMRIGAKATVEELSKGGRRTQFDSVLDRIGSGDPAWIALAPKLATGTDGEASEGLGIALAEALPKNPGAVLRTIDPGNPLILGPARVCGMPFIEPSRGFLRRYRTRALKALAQMRDPAVEQMKVTCISILRGADGTGRSDPGAESTP